MIRQFLALVAILTGLTTLTAPAQARISVQEGVSVQAQGEDAGAVQLAAVCAILCARNPSHFTAVAAMLPLPAGPVLAAPVLIQVDRAHE